MELSVNKAILNLIYNLPIEMHKVWWTLEELTDHLHRGGVDSKMPVGFVERALKFDRSGVIATRRDNNKKFYLTGEESKAHFSTARDQIASLANGFALPRISRCLFTRFGRYKKELQCIANSLVKSEGTQSDKVEETTGVLNNRKSCPVPENPATPTQPEENNISKNHVTPSPHGGHSSSSPTKL
jgi:hypothetical protein